MSDKPKHCPWCGWHGDKICISPGETYRWMLPMCAACGATPGETRVVERLPNGTPLSDSPANYAAALEMWNTRASPLRPIETAPKDGTYVIVWPPTYEGVTSCAQWETQQHYNKPKPYWRRLDAIHVRQSRQKPPTHWMPLPEPPKD